MSKKNDGKLSLIGLIGVAVGSTIASGVFSFSGDFAANGAGTGAVLIGWGICGIGMLALSLCFFGLNRARPELTGGIYSYAKAGFGDYYGFNAAWGYWLSALLGNVSFLTLLFASIGYFLPIFGEGNNLASTIGSSILLWFIVWLLLRGVQEAAKVNLIVAIAKMMPILSFIIAIVLLNKFDLEIFIDNFWGEDTGLTIPEQVKATTYTTVWVFIGIEGAVVISARARVPKDVGRATVISFLTVLSIYVVISILSMGIMTRAELADLNNPPLAYVFEKAVGKIGAIVINAGLIISVLGATLGYTLIATECMAEAASQGAFTKFFARVNKNGSPTTASYFTNGLVQLFVIVLYFNSSTYQIFYIISAGMSMIPYLLSAGYYFKINVLGEENNRLKGTIIGCIGTLYGLWMLYSAGFSGILVTALLYAPGTIFYIRSKKEKNQQPFDNLADKVLLIVILVMFVFSAYFLAVGTINPF